MFPEITRDDVFRLESRRLWLRWPVAEDAASIAAIASGDAGSLTVHGPHPCSKGETHRQIEEWRLLNTMGTGLVLAMTGHGSDQTAFGVVGVEHLDDGATLGLILAPNRRGLGLATEAVQAIVDATFMLGKVSDVAASVRVINPVARRVIERCGFAYEATILKDTRTRGGMVPCDCFRLDRKAWTSLKQWRMPVAYPLPHTAEAGSRRVSAPDARTI